MKLSNYVIDQEVCDGNRILYNVASRRYYAYSKEEQDYIKELLKNINKENYTLKEAETIKSMYSKGIIIDDNIDELDVLEYEEKKCTCRDSILRLTVYLTNACNFRCTYCQQEHINKNIDDQTVNSVILYLIRESKKRRNININWFGGEPLLQYETIIKILKKVLPVAQENGCVIISSVVTNGYLLDEAKARELYELGVKTMQITVDGNKASHDSRRVLVNGQGTYDRVLSGVESASRNGIKVILRMNINKDNLNNQTQILEDIDPPLRKNIHISIANIFQENEKVSSFEIKMYAYSLGYKNCERYNNFYGCQSCGHNAVAINTDGKILFCTNCEGDDEVGYLKDDGRLIYKNRQLYEQRLDKSLIKNVECRKCKELPLCLGGCRYYNAFADDGTCRGKRADGMSLEEVAYLDYYYDTCNKREA
ncbi:radical SAM/SPASM domain-containing protein [Pseudobutyrivibrio xylanivorans]|uniref:Radical SAM protein n=1 Tax=Pseudobutyrivibrio xylanivorans TaxID=185007 RepID=A0A5P6VQA2_PSEXY|nr:radical SAM protein [Pseudobutyrivibrio xylanivorans]QFJ54873.1 radical SAM protein [Pseudobutyrivibrio xylanivorans]